ncbi:MAG: ASCH domain-containing protein, partial [Candidatus Ornithospirochaeta sp.]
MKKEELWKGYLKEGNKDEEYQAWAFCGGGKEADELLALVKEGKKWGTASSLISYEMEKEPIPKEGDKSIVLNSRNEGELVIVTRKVTITP